MVKRNFLANLADRVIGTPLLMHPEKASIVLSVLQGRVALGDIDVEEMTSQPSPEASQFKGTRRRDSGQYGLSPAENGIAIISILGSLVNRGAWVGASSGLTSYEGIAAQIDNAIADPEINGILLDINSPGGEATGMFNLAKKIQNARDTKPIYAIVNDMAASAAYGIACSASRIFISETSFVGSIGVVMLHLDQSAKMKKEGIKATFIHAGKHKVDGHSFGPLTDSVKSDLQSTVDAIYDRFISTVETGRGERISAENAQKTEARMFMGQDAIEAGLADEVAAFDEVLTQMQGLARSGKFKTQENTTMATEKTETEIDAEAIKAEASASGSKSERARINSILNCDAADGRSAQANFLAFETEMSVDDATKMLEASAKDAPKTEASDKTQTIEQRADGLDEIGKTDPQGIPADANHGWGKATAEHNKRFS